MFQKASAKIAATVALGLAAASAQAAPAGGYALVNGLKMYYESRGSGPPLVRQLGLGKADILGYSLAGGVALQTAIRHPQVVRRLVVVSTPFRRDGWYPEILAGMSQMGAESAEPMKQDYDWSREAAELQMPVLIVAGDADAVRLTHVVEFFALLGGGQRDAGWDGSGRSQARLAILPGATHYDIFSRPELAATALQFLDSPLPAGGSR